MYEIYRDFDEVEAIDADDVKPFENVEAGRTSGRGDSCGL